jgi:hypothetical protein
MSDESTPEPAEIEAKTESPAAESEAPKKVEAAPAEAKPLEFVPAPEVQEEEPSKFKFSEGDTIFIHSNHGKFVAIVRSAYASRDEAEADYPLSFQTITKRGPLYDYNAPHYLCSIANPGKKDIGACETDCELKPIRG